ncbi:glycosyltransferase family 2 protein [Plastoroseomonas hellenica]|uniref:glycosyltransferase family 2 protein n=1 Tax=Plastoroseomonas hellenica TaxID=2687306 RepID=UPI001BAD1644|nr:glycosyltransferase family 2 protein [Plastoroseomonas hellenica]
MSSGTGEGAVPPLRLAIGIATIGRAAILAETIAEVRRQTRRPDRLVLCGTRPEDVAGIVLEGPNEMVVMAAAGLPRQRNRILDATADCDVVLFLDDDFLMRPDYLAETERMFATLPGLVVSTGTVLADGIGGPGLSPAEGRAILAADQRNPSPVGANEPTFCGYGCNMAVQAAVARRHGIRVDERLPLYAWQEDVDFTRRLAAHGAVLRLAGARGVHLGTKLGRGSGLRLGYSQVANPLYLARKTAGGAYPFSYARTRILRNLSANLLRATWPEPHVDRRGRLRGNLLALLDLLRGRMAPERVLEL